jgi:hypothetical protein
MGKTINWHYFNEFYKDLVIIKNNSYVKGKEVKIDIEYSYNPNNETRLDPDSSIQVRVNSLLATLKNKKYCPSKNIPLVINFLNQTFQYPNNINQTQSSGYMDEFGNIIITSEISFGSKNIIHIYGLYNL